MELALKLAGVYMCMFVIVFGLIWLAIEMENLKPKRKPPIKHIDIRI
jgi:hypothetical protein